MKLQMGEMGRGSDKLNLYYSYMGTPKQSSQDVHLLKKNKEENKFSVTFYRHTLKKSIIMKTLNQKY